MAAFTGYCDASGSETEGEVVVAVGAIADVDDWGIFDEQWIAALKEFRVGRFHMKDFAHFKKSFAEDWEGPEHEEKRIAFLNRLISLTNERVERIYATTVLRGDVDAVNAEYELVDQLGGGYALAQASTIVRAMSWLQVEKAPEDLLAFLVERGDPGQDAFRRLLHAHIGDMADYVHIIPKRTLENDDVTPFNVPDFIAYEYRISHAFRAARGFPQAKERGSLNAIRRSLYPRVGILEADALRRMCEAAGVKRRNR